MSENKKRKRNKKTKLNSNDKERQTFGISADLDNTEVIDKKGIVKDLLWERMGRTTSKINKKFEDLLSSNTLPRCAASKMKKLRGSFRHKNRMEEEEEVERMRVEGVESRQTVSDTNSLARFSDKVANDSGFYDTSLARLDESLCESSSSTTTSHLHTMDESICSDDHQDVGNASAAALNLRPLYFEVPDSSGGGILHRRPQVLDRLTGLLCRGCSRGAVITGAAGTGKTSVLLDLVQNSFFGGYASTDYLHARVVGYHFLTAGDQLTQDLAHLIHSLAAQLSQHPALTAYRDLLLADSDMAGLLSIRRLREDPGRGLEVAILEPLRRLHRAEEIDLDMGIILVDGLDQEHSRSNSVIADFLAKNILRFPSWLKLVLTHRTESMPLTALTSLPYIRLDLEEDNGVQSELMDYLESRIFSSETLLTSLTQSVPKQRKNMMIAKFVTFVHDQAEGSWLYARLVLDLISLGYLSVKSESFSFVPRSLAEVFHLYLSFRFPTAGSYALVKSIFSVCLASSGRPVSLAEVGRVLRSSVPEAGDTSLLRDEYAKVSDLLVTRSDNTLLFLHPELAEWLTAAGGHRFHVPPVTGHNHFMWFYDRRRVAHTADVLELAHHLDKTDLFDINNCEYFSNWDRKYLYLAYKVETATPLAKSLRLSECSSFISDGCLSLLKLALKTTKA